jgi:hypothetical protein
MINVFEIISEQSEDTRRKPVENFGCRWGDNKIIKFVFKRNGIYWHRITSGNGRRWILGSYKRREMEHFFFNR